MRRDPSQYRPDLRPMLILVALLAATVVGWILLAPLILPPVDRPVASATGLDGRWTRTPDEPLRTTLALSGAAYTVDTAPGFIGSGSAARDGDELVLSGDATCAGAEGRYAVELGDVARFGLLPENRAQTMTLTTVTDGCAARAGAVAGTWTLRASGRDGIHGICDPPNEEAAVTGHWPEPPGCAPAQ